jgi:hypothetical protein
MATIVTSGNRERPDKTKSIVALHSIKALNTMSELQGEMGDTIKDPKGRYMWETPTFNLDPHRALTNQEPLTSGSYMLIAREIHWTVPKNRSSIFYTTTMSCLRS